MTSLKKNQNQNQGIPENTPLFNWLFVDLNSYFASVEQQLNPKLRGKPVAVVPMLSDSTCVIAASYEAKKYGVKTNTMVRDARSMCPGITFIEGQHLEYVRYHKKIVEAVESCHPVTAVCSVDEMACRLQGRDQKFKNAIELSYDIKGAILKKVGECLTSSVGLAPNRFLAKVASDMQKPDGLTYILPWEIPDKLLSLKLRDLIGIGARMEKRLNAQGIHSVEKLYSLSVHEMRSIWGGLGGERFYKWLRGEDLELSYEKNKSVGHQHVLPPELRTMKGAYHVGLKLLNKAGVRLRRLNAWASHISIRVKYVDRTYWANDAKILECQDTLSLQEAFSFLWQTVTPETPLKISVTLSHLVHESERSFSFFENKKRLDLSRAADAINERYGPYTVHFGGIHEALSSAPTRIAFSNIPEVNSDIDKGYV